MEPTYKIIRTFREDHPSRVIKTGLSLEEAQEHCRDRQTSSRTCTTAEGIKVTEKYGDWFDAYEEE